jgi:hypothetical protein
MAVGQGYSKTATNGLVFAYDTGDTRNSFLGRPTTNLMEGYGLSNYNNVPGSVTTNLTQTNDTYRGAPVWIQTLTPLDGSGVSWLSNGNNPGLGVVTSGGGGTANRYTGFSIFYKPTVPMYNVPIFLAYSNIGGWQCNTCPPEDMGDGWFRAKVLWYDTTTRGDGKYWAINPLSATLNTPITVYWAGPFKEDLNSQYISQYTPTSRSNTQSLLALAGGNSVSVADVSFNSNLQITFDGTNDHITISSFSLNPNTNGFTYETILNSAVANTSYGSWKNLVGMGGGSNVYGILVEADTRGYRLDVPDTSGNRIGVTTNINIPANTNIHIVWSWENGVFKFYENGVLQVNSNQGAYSAPDITGVAFGTGINVSNGYWYGNQFVNRIYSRALSAGEIKQNYGHYKTRFNLP